MSRLTHSRDIAVDLLKHVPRIVQRADCKSSTAGDTCEKPLNTNTTTYVIVAATV